MSTRRLTLFVAAALLATVAGAAASSVKEAEASAPGARPVPAPTTPRKIDEYGNLRWSDEKARLDNYAVELQVDPTIKAYIICYGGRVSREGEARRRCRRAANYLVGRRGIAAERVVTADGGFREELTVELWPWIPGTDPPYPIPTIDPREAKIIKAAARLKHGRRRL